MKNLLIFSVLAAAFVVACSSSEGPKEVATKFITHLNAGEYDKAGELGTDNTKEMLNMIKMFAGEEKPEAAAAFTISDVKEEAESATVTYRTDGAEADETLNMVKADGKWLVDMVKEEGMGDMDMGDMDMEGEPMEGDTLGMEETIEEPATEEVQE